MGTIDFRALYQRSLLGAMGGLLGWAAITWLLPVSFSNVYVGDLVSGALIGLCLGAACGAWDGLFRNRSPRRFLRGVSLGGILGLVGGMLGLVVGEGIFTLVGGGIAPRALGWALFGAFIGVNEGLARRMWNQGVFGTYGGFLGGLVGGSTYEWLFGFCRHVFTRDVAQAVGGAVGLVLLGLFIGAFIGLVEDLLRTAWLRFVSGRFEGQTRTLDPRKRVVRIGQAETADICIRGDPALVLRHAQILHDQQEFYLEAVDGIVQVGPPGCQIPVTRHRLQPDDTFQLGASRIRFHSRRG